MTVQPSAQVPWFQHFPFEEETRGFEGAPVFVDVGGGFGQQCGALLQAFPAMRDRLVLQDLPAAMQHMPPLDGVKAMAHDFFQPQPVQGARFYYLRNVLHDWPDEKAVEILRSLRAAMGPRSQILIDEMVMPSEQAHWCCTSLDLVMMSCLGSRQRTVEDWNRVLEAAGLRIVKIHTYITREKESIIQIGPA